MQTSEIRQKFIQFFKAKYHTVVESSSLVPHNDPTLLFTNAGMNQFKDVFLGREKRDFVRAVSSQKVVRAGGKHNDLENVGFTARHHTFFEMLGNFSFGDYFKKDAISYAWEFVTSVLKIPKSQLHVTVFNKDDEAEKIWHEQEGVPLDRISRLGEKDNFWQMGDTGPCGPCSEIFVDRGEKYCEKRGKNDPGCKVGCDCDRYMEIWNLVFMQYNRDEAGNLAPLPKPSVDTGAGLERLASVMQNVDTNYDIDLFIDIIRKTANLAKGAYVPGDALAPSYRVIADHARAATFLIADGVIPSNEGRGYVLRRILRRAIRHGKKIGFEKPFLHRVCGFVIEQMQTAFPYLKDQANLIDRCVHAEEEQFFRTLATGLELLDVEAAKLGGKGCLAGEIAFKLYDTFGFPVDLTRMICQERGLDVDENGFELAMEQQKARSREHWKGSGDAAVANDYHSVYELLKSAGTLPKFLGYTELSATGTCVAVLPTNKSDVVEAIFSPTPFYGESGGQVGDHGRVTSIDGGKSFSAEVLDVQKPVHDLIVCTLQINIGEIKVGTSYQQQVDADNRAAIASNHTATHLLHWALRKKLGDHVKQAGSLVGSEQLRFDFTHFQQVSANELEEIEQSINRAIWSTAEVKKVEMTKDAAIAHGAIAMFGEKYTDTVRVVSVGDFSVELCGGTHVNRASDIHLFKIISEAGIAAGVRRITAVSGVGAFSFLNERYLESKLLRDRLKANSKDELLQKIDRQAATEKELRKSIEQLQSKNRANDVAELLKTAKKVGNVVTVVTRLDNYAGGAGGLRDFATMIKQSRPDVVAIIGSVVAEENKAYLFAACGKNATTAFDAAAIIKDLSPLIEGRGGGKSDLAQAGGSKLSGLDDALNAAKKLFS